MMVAVWCCGDSFFCSVDWKMDEAKCTTSTNEKVLGAEKDAWDGQSFTFHQDNNPTHKAVAEQNYLNQNAFIC